MNYIEISEHIKQNYLVPMENYEINNLQDIRNLHDELIKVNSDLQNKFGFSVMPHYRGEQNCEWDILPGIFRSPFSKGVDLTKAREMEKAGTEFFKNMAVENFGKEQIFKQSSKPYGEKWDLLFQAQHAGVKTNLIDLSTNAVLASFFMCESSEYFDDLDGQFWALLVPYELVFNETTDYEKSLYPKFNPFDLDKSFVCNVPTFIDDIDERTYQFRLFKQHGRLFASNNLDLEIPLNKKDFWKNMILRVKVPAKAKKVIFDELKKVNVDRKSMMIVESEEVEGMINDINIQIKTVGNTI